ncbi:hypothetical protein [Paenibacillus sp. yr247]|uniref:hypothetical protein n=1 Tax=Paenibacillus sp. yr247 TaxID=1761880 RepID=UPI0015878093|nr:hypothetical protein [Paenibacillus sp. yr247]
MRRKRRLGTLFRLFNEQLFHGLGVSNEDLFRFPWFQCDSSGVFAPRKFGSIYTRGRQIPLPSGWTVEQGIGYGLKLFTSLEENYHDECPASLLIPPEHMPEPLSLF